MKTFGIMNLIDATNYGFTVSGTTIFSATTFYAYVRARFNHMMFDCYTVADDADETDPAIVTAAKAEFKAVFDMWKDCVGDDYKRAFDALAATYNPLENYDRMEEGSETDERHKGSVDTETVEEAGEETNAHHKGTKTATGEEIISTPRVQTKATTYKVAFDSSSETETDAVTTEPTQGTDKVERDATKNFTTVQDIDGTTFDKDVRSFNERETTRTTTHADIDASTFDKDVHTFTNRRTHGNIGVTTSQQMLLSELELRIKNYVADAIDSFVKMYCYFWKGVE